MNFVPAVQNEYHDKTCGKINVKNETCVKVNVKNETCGKINVKNETDKLLTH